MVCKSFVSLKSYEFRMGSQVGIERYVRAIEKNLKDQNTFGEEDDPMAAHVYGALGELAMAKFLRTFWNGSVDVFRSQYDLEFMNIEVRTARSHGHNLIVRKKDKDDRIYALTTVDISIPTEFCIWGWISGSDAKQDKYLRSHGSGPPAWFVPKKILNPFPMASFRG